MFSLRVVTWIGNAATVLSGRCGAISQRAREVGCSREAMYQQEQRVSIWIYEGHLRIAYHQTVVARYRCDYDPQHGQLHDVREPMLYPPVLVRCTRMEHGGCNSFGVSIGLLSAW